MRSLLLCTVFLLSSCALTVYSSKPKVERKGPVVFNLPIEVKGAPQQVRIPRVCVKFPVVETKYYIVVLDTSFYTVQVTEKQYNALKINDSFLGK